MTTRKNVREKRVLAKAIIQAGVERNAGETVELRPDQIARLEPDGYFESEAPARERRGGAGTETAS